MMQETREMIVTDRKILEELRMNMQRLKKHDEYFNECNRKLIQIDATIKQNEKKTKEEIMGLHSMKNMIRERVN
jgi:hypothetical protein